MDFLKKNYKYIGLGGCILTAIGNFLPLLVLKFNIVYTSKSLNIEFIDGDGKIVLIMAIIAAILILTKKYMGALIPTFISAAITIYDLSNVNEKFDLLSEYADLHYGLGFWLIVIGFVLTIGAVVINHLESKNIKTETVSTTPVSTTYSEQPVSSTETHKKYCEYCGAEIDTNTNFCSNCGTKL